jgi:Mrp family chromosome partitioning ATPase
MVKIHESVTDAQTPNNSKKNQEDALKGSLQKIKHKFMIMSGKGGVGKTSISVNLSIALAKKGFNVGIMDVDLHGPDVPKMLGLKGTLDLGKDNKLNPMNYTENLKAVSIESLTARKDDAIIWRGPLKNSAIRQFIGEVEWGELDFLIVDSPGPDNLRCQSDYRNHTTGDFACGRQKIHKFL